MTEIKNIHLYLHRVRGKIKISATTPVRPFLKKLLEIKDEKYSFSLSTKTFRNFKNGVSYRVIEVKLNDKGVVKHWAYIDDINNKIYFDSFLPFTRIFDFKRLLENNGIRLFYSNEEVNYVEICCRYQREKIDDVANAIEKLIRGFNTNKTEPIKRGISNGEDYVYIVKNLFYKGYYFNLKSYLFVDNFKGEDQEISDYRLPKLEVQIKETESIRQAEAIGIPILKSIIESVGLETTLMDKDFEKDDYEKLIGTEEYGHNEEVNFYLEKKPKRQTLTIIPNDISKNKTDTKIMAYLWYEKASLKNICTQLKISEKTFYRSYKRLGNIIERRGGRCSKYVYQIDHIYLNNISHYKENISKQYPLNN